MAINGLHPDMKRENGERKRPCHRPHRFPGRFAMVVYKAKCYFCQINVIKTVFRATPDKKGQHLKSGVNPRHRLCRHIVRICAGRAFAAHIGQTESEEGV